MEEIGEHAPRCARRILRRVKAPVRERLDLSWLGREERVRISYSYYFNFLVFLTMMCQGLCGCSCWNPGNAARDELDTLQRGDPDLEPLRTIAENVIRQRLSRGASFQLLQGTRYYHHHHVNPNWADSSKKVHDDGKHVFYAGIA